MSNKINDLDVINYYAQTIQAKKFKHSFLDSVNYELYEKLDKERNMEVILKDGYRVDVDEDGTIKNITNKEKTQSYEYVNHPSHYGGEDNPYECIKVIEAWGLDKNFDLGTAVRYICRAGEKPDNPTLQDLKKARWYLDREIQKMEKRG